MYIFIDAENSQWMMKFSMLILTVYLFFSVSRIVAYAFWLPSKKKKWAVTGISAGSLLFLFFLYSAFVTRTDYEVNEVEISFNNLPEEFDGYNIVFISDIHIGTMWNAGNELRELSERINELDPDLLLFGGDIVNIHHSELTPEVLSVLSGMKGKDGVFSVLGNHDTGAYINGSTAAVRSENISMIRKKLDSAGWTLLQDSTVYICRGNDSIALTGIDYSEELQDYKHSMSAIKGYDIAKFYKEVPDSIFNITLSHLPQLWYSLCDGGYSDLTLSGHTLSYRPFDAMMPSVGLQVNPDAVRINPNITYKGGVPQLSLLRSFYSLYGYSSGNVNWQGASFKLNNGMRINTYEEYNADGYKVYNPSAMPWERNDFNAAFEFKSADGKFGIMFEVHGGRNNGF